MSEIPHELLNPETPSARLVALASPLLSVKTAAAAARRDLIARHPNAPWSLLRSLILDHAEAVLANPALMLHRLSDPGLPLPLSMKALAALSAHPKALAQAMGWPDPEDESGRWGPLQLALTCLHYQAQRRIRYSGYEIKSPEQMWVYLQDVLRSERALPPEVWRRLLSTLQSYRRADVAQRGKCPWVLEILASESERLAHKVAGNTDAPPYLLDVLGSSPSSMIRSAAASNQATASYTLRRLSQDRDVAVRAALLNRREIPEDVLATLQQDGEHSIRRRARSRLS